MLTRNEIWLCAIGGIVLTYLVLGDHVLPLPYQPTTLLTQEEEPKEPPARQVVERAEPATAPEPVLKAEAPPAQRQQAKPAPPAPALDRRAQITGFCMELIAVRYNRLDVYQMLSSGMMTDLIDQHRAWRKAGGIKQTPACAVQIRSRLEDGLYQMLGNIGNKILGSMGHAAALDFALQRCVSSATSSC